MRTLALMLATTLAAAGLCAQSNVDRLVDQLDYAAKGTLNNWKWSTDFSQDPTVQGFDDSRWHPLTLNESLYVDSCLIREEIVLPERILGEPIHGAIRLVLSVDDYGYLWVNGMNRGYFPWDGDFVLTNDPKPGERFVLVIKAINTGGPLRLIRAGIQSESMKGQSEDIENLALSFSVGQKLLSFDTYQTNATRKFDPGVDRSTTNRQEKERLGSLLQQLATEVDVQALNDGKVAQFNASVARVRNSLKPIGEYAHRFTLVFNSNAHIDAAWLWRSKETIDVCKNTFTSVLDMMDARPDFTYTQSAAVYYKWMQDLYPDVFRRIRQRVQDGRWEVVGGMWIEPDCNLPSGESWMRQLLYAKRYFSKNLGVNVVLGWNPDSFGYNWNMPQFYREAGIDAFITQKIGWNDTNVFPYRVFWWEGPDGSRVLSYFPFDYVNEVTDPFKIADWSRQFEANTGFRKVLVLFGVGDHGGGPSNEMLDRIERLKKVEVYPTIEYNTAQTYIDWLKQQDLTRLPVWDDELYLEYHRGTFTTQAHMKASNRRAEVLLTNVEKLSTLAARVGHPYPGKNLQDAWEGAMFNQFHDILPGSSIRQVYIDAAETYQQVFEIGKTELGATLKSLAGSINTTAFKGGEPLVVFNPLAWERTDLVRVPLPDDGKERTVVDGSGRVIPSQIVKTGRYTRDFLFIAGNVPSLGYKTYVLKLQARSAPATALKADKNILENEFFRVQIDPEEGWVKSIVDKRDSREVLSGPGNQLQLLEDRPRAWDAWNIGLTGVEFPSSFRSAELVESGPVRAVLRVHRDYRKPGTSTAEPTTKFPTTFFTQDVILYTGLDRVDFETDVDWWEDKTMLKVAFPVTVSDTSATYEIPFGSIERTTQRRNSIDSAKFEVPAQRWADLSATDYGVSLLNNSKYGYDIRGSTMRLSLLRSPQWPDPTADRGKHAISYALYPHEGTWKEARTVRRGYEFNDPLIAVMTGVHKGALPPEQAMVRLSPEHLVLTTLKKAEDSDAWIVQWYDATGEASTAVLTLPSTPTKVVRSTILEDDGERVPFTGPVVTVPTGASRMVILKVYF